MISVINKVVFFCLILWFLIKNVIGILVDEMVDVIEVIDINIKNNKLMSKFIWFIVLNSLGKIVKINCFLLINLLLLNIFILLCWVIKIVGIINKFVKKVILVLSSVIVLVNLGRFVFGFK